MHRAFQIGLGLKTLNALLECLAGIALFVIPASALAAAIAGLTQHELQQDPHDFVATHLIGWAQQLSPSATWYYAVYLFLHGAVKLGLVAALFKGWLWAYPLSLVVFGGFIVYQLYRYSLHPSWGLIALSVLDAVVMWLIWREYRDVKQRHTGSKAGAA
jgi:uncharacterized membrane protein